MFVLIISQQNDFFFFLLLILTFFPIISRRSETNLQLRCKIEDHTNMGCIIDLQSINERRSILDGTVKLINLRQNRLLFTEDYFEIPP